MFVRDGRTLPFVPVTTAALEAIRAACADQPRRLGYARSLYLALLELANAARESRVALSRKTLGAQAGCSPELITDLRGLLEAAGVVVVHERVFDNQRLENEWVVIEPGLSDPPAAQTGPPAAQAERSQERLSSLTTTTENSTAGKQGELVDEPSRVRAQAREAGRPTPGLWAWSFRGKAVPLQVRETALGLLADYERLTGQTVRARRAVDGRPTDALTRITGALLDYPDVSAERWKTVMANVVASPPSWADGPMSVGVIFGPRAVERHLACEGRYRPNGNGNGQGSTGAKFSGPLSRAAGLAPR